MKIRFILNKKPIEMDVEPQRRVIDLLREDMGMTGTKEGCGCGDCGACTILVNGENRLACLMLAPQLDGKNITTIEGLKENGKMHPLQEAFVTQGAIQCGFCTPGMIMTAYAFLQKHRVPSRIKIREAISGNLCRCTGYEKIIDAIEAAAKKTNKQGKEKRRFEHYNMLQKHQEVHAFMPETLDELWDLLDKKPDALFYAGGTDLLVKLRDELVSNRAQLICLERNMGLKAVFEENGKVFIGSCSTHSQLIKNPIIRKRFPILVNALKSIGSRSIRNMGTIGGNICTASPAGDTLPPLYAMDAQVEIRSKTQKRIMPIKDFVLGPGKTALKKGEILYGIWLDSKETFNVQHFEKVGQRQALTISIASLAALIKCSENGIVEKVRFAWGSVGETVVRSKEIEDAVLGKPLREETLKALMPIVYKTVSPIDDIRASATYRRILSGNLLLRLIQ